MKPVFVVILNYKNWHDVEECLESVLRSDYNKLKVFVIDNASGNDSLQHLQAWTQRNTIYHPPFEKTASKLLKPISSTITTPRDLAQLSTLDSLPQVVFVQNNINNGFAGGNNVVLRILQSFEGFVWLLNPDMVVQATAISALVRCAAAVADAAIIGSLVKSYDPPHNVVLYGGGIIKFSSATVQLVTEKTDPVRLDYISGGSMFFESSLLKTVGLLPENYFLYWEETDWCYRAKKQGIKFVVCEESVCYDKGSTTIGKSYLSDFYYTRNGLKFLSTYKPAAVSTALFYVYLRLIKRLFSGQFDRARGMWNGTKAFREKTL